MQNCFLTIFRLQVQLKTGIFVIIKIFKQRTMHKKIILLFLLIITINGIANAQYWSKEDSIWLKNMLEGEEIKINEETKKAIEDGRLSVPSWMKNAENQLDKIELLKEFEDAQVPDSVRLRRIDPYTMPPAVFALYV
jgi:hypothetical protein